MLPTEVVEAGIDHNEGLCARYCGTIFEIKLLLDKYIFSISFGNGQKGFWLHRFVLHMLAYYSLTSIWEDCLFRLSTACNS